MFDKNFLVFGHLRLSIFASYIFLIFDFQQKKKS